MLGKLYCQSTLTKSKRLNTDSKKNKVHFYLILLDQNGAKSGDVKLSTAIESQFADVFSKIGLIKNPLEEAVVTNPQQVADVYESLSKLQTLIQDDLVAGLDLYK